MAKFAPPKATAPKAAAPTAPAKGTKATPPPEAKSTASSKSTPAPATTPSSSGNDAEVTKVGNEIRELKEKLKSEGLSGKKINDHEQIKQLVAKLNELKAAAAAAPAPQPAQASTTPATAPATGGNLDEQVKAVGDQIRALKEKLKSEGLSGKKINEHDEVKKLVAQLNELKSGAAAAPAPAAPQPTAAPPAAPASSAADGGDLEAQIKAVGDEIRVLKEKLKGEGLSGKKVNDHAEVKGLVAKLNELKAKQ